MTYPSRTQFDLPGPYLGGELSGGGFTMLVETQLPNETPGPVSQLSAAADLDNNSVGKLMILT